MAAPFEANVDSDLVTVYPLYTPDEADDIVMVWRPKDLSDRDWQFVASVIYHAFNSDTGERVRLAATGDVNEFFAGGA